MEKKLWSSKISDIGSFYFDFDFCEKEEFRTMIGGALSLGCTYSILVRVEFNDGIYRMLGSQIGLVIRDSNDMLSIDGVHNQICNRLGQFNEYYKVEKFNSIQVLFVKIDTLPRLALTNLNKLDLSTLHINSKDIKFKFNSKFLPLTTNPNYYGKLITGDNRINYLKIINQQLTLLGKSLFDLKDFNDMYLHDNYIVLSTKTGERTFTRELYNSTLGTFEGRITDVIISNNMFERKYNNVTFSINNGNVSLGSVSKDLPLINTNYKSGRKREVHVSNPNIGTFDLETFEDSDGYSKVYAAGFCVYNKGEPVLFYLDKSNYNNVLIDCLNSMLISKYNNHIFYVHNLSFDGVSIIHQLKTVNEYKGFEYYKIKPLYKDSSILKLEIRVEKESPTKTKSRDIKITFLDSFSLLNSKLSKLCKAFDVDTYKGNFPHKFAKANKLNYIGKTPDFKDWSDLSLEDYNLLVKDDWNLKEESLSYLRKDLLSLLQIMRSFSQYVYRKFNIELTECLTISRLSFNIFSEKYLGDAKIPLIKGDVYTDIKNAYYGGVTEVYKPYGKNLYYYDVNSLYPYAALNPMCNNKYTYLESYDNLGLNLDNLFGFFYCEIEASNNYLGLLPVRLDGFLVMPVGTWKGWYFSEELKFALQRGYKIKVVRGYNFEKQYNIFDNYVNYLYEIKATTSNSVEKTVVKSLLNNLLGRFGLNINRPITQIVTKEVRDLIISTREYNSFARIANNEFLISYYPKISKHICESHGLDYLKVLNELKINSESNEFKDVSLVIAAAVTSYARIYMSMIKMDILNKKGNIFYTDTDSLVTDIPLDKHLVGNSLGQFKLVHTVKEGYFISPKTYALILEDNTVVFKNKGVLENTLQLQDFIDLYNGTDVKGTKRNTITTYDKGSVVIRDEEIVIKHDAYTKREKIYNSKNQWIDTKPLVIENDFLINLDNSNNSKKKPPSKFWYNILRSTLKLGINVLYVILAFIIVSLFGNILDFNVSSQKYININDISKNITSLKSCSYKNNFVTENIIKTKIPPSLALESNQSNLENIFENIVHELISYKSLNNRKFLSLNSVIQFSHNYILQEISSGNLKLSLNDYNKLINSIKDIKNNTELYKLICDTNFKIDGNIQYNLVSKKYLNNYTKWVIDPHSNKFPGEMHVKNKLSLQDELEFSGDNYLDTESINENYTYLVNEIDKIIGDIDVTLGKTPRIYSSNTKPYTSPGLNSRPFEPKVKHTLK